MVMLFDCRLTKNTSPKLMLVGEMLTCDAAPTTVKLKLCVAVPTVLEAVKVMPKTPLVDGVPANVAVPFPLLLKVIPTGRAPVSAIVGGGKPEAVTVTEPTAAARTAAVFALVIAGIWLTVR